MGNRLERLIFNPGRKIIHFISDRFMEVKNGEVLIISKDNRVLEEEYEEQAKDALKSGSSIEQLMDMHSDYFKVKKPIIGPTKLYFRRPFTDAFSVDVTTWHTYDPDPRPFPTLDKVVINANPQVKWRISNPIMHFLQYGGRGYTNQEIIEKVEAHIKIDAYEVIGTAIRGRTFEELQRYKIAGNTSDDKLKEIQFDLGIDIKVVMEGLPIINEIQRIPITETTE